VEYDPAAQPPPEVLAEAYLLECQQAKWAADAELKTAARALSRLLPPPNFKGVRTEYDMRFWLAGDTMDPGTPSQLAERARRDALREDLNVATTEHIRAKHAARRAAKALTEAQELMGTEPEAEDPFDELCLQLRVQAEAELQAEQDELDDAWEMQQLQREADEDFARTCEQRARQGRAHVEAWRSYADQMRRDMTRRMLHEDAERVWGAGWQSR
jgi:hypothetical protein